MGEGDAGAAAQRGGADGARADRDADVRVFLRPLGTPIALGLSGLVIGAVMSSGLELGWLDGVREQRTVAFAALGSAAPLELIAAVFAFLARDALVGTGLGIFSTMWLVSGLTLLGAAPGTTNDAEGLFLLLGAVGLLLLLISAGSGRPVLGAIIAIGCVRLALAGLYQVTSAGDLETAAGLAGLALGAVSAYGIVALLTEDLPRKALLPVGRAGKAAASVAGGFPEQLDELENEAGVRRQL